VPSINDRLKSFFSDMTTDVLEERVVDYVVREVHKGRRLAEVLDDPYVRNRFDADKRNEIFENPEIAEALEAEIRQAMTGKERDIL
jgi:hypothetical protein